MKKVVISEKK